MQRKCSLLLMSCLALALPWGNLSRAGDPPLVAGEVTPATVPLPEPLGVGLGAIFRQEVSEPEIFLSLGSPFLKGGARETLGGPSSQPYIRALWRAEFYRDLMRGVAILDRTLRDWLQSHQLSLQLSREQRKELTLAVNEAIAPELRTFHSGAAQRSLVMCAWQLAEVKAKVYQQIFLYLSEHIGEENIREFMQQRFEPSGGAAGSFLPRAEHKEAFLALWLKNFHQLNVLLPPMQPEEAAGLFAAYRKVLQSRAPELHGEPSAEVSQVVESFLTLLYRCDPQVTTAVQANRLVLAKYRTLPFSFPGAVAKFRKALLALAGQEEQIGSDRPLIGSARTWGLEEKIGRAIQELAQADPALRPTPAERRAEAVERGQLGPESGSYRLHDLFQPGSFSEKLYQRMDRRTLSGLLGAQLLMRLQYSALVLEETLSVMGYRLPRISREDLYRLTELLYEGYHRYGEPERNSERDLFLQLNRVEKAYWRRVSDLYLPVGLETKFLPGGFTPRKGFMSEFVAIFSRTAQKYPLPDLSLAETELLLRALPRLREPDLAAEVAHLWVAHAPIATRHQFPGLQELRHEVREYELHPMWVSKKKSTASTLLRELLRLEQQSASRPEAAWLRSLVRQLRAIGLQPSEEPPLPDLGAEVGLELSLLEAGAPASYGAERYAEEGRPSAYDAYEHLGMPDISAGTGSGTERGRMEGPR